MTARYKKALIAFTTFIGGLYFFLEFVLPKKIGGFEFGFYHDQISKGVQVVGIMAIGLGVINILKVHGSNIFKTKKGWGNSVALIIGFFLMLGVEIVDVVDAEKSTNTWKEIENLAAYTEVIKKDREKNDPIPRSALLVEALEKLEKRAISGEGFFRFDATVAKEAALHETLVAKLAECVAKAKSLENAYRNLENIEQPHSTLVQTLRETVTNTRDLTSYNYEESMTKKIYTLLQQGFFVALGSAMFSLLAFYIAGAAYRSFRVRSWEASLMMVTALIVMLGQIPHGPLYISEYLPEIRLWLLKNVSTPAFRAIFFGSAIAGLAMAVRMWLSLERSPLATEDAED